MCVSASAYELRFFTLKYFVFAVYKILGCSPSRYDLERLTCDLCVQSIVCHTHTLLPPPHTHAHTHFDSTGLVEDGQFFTPAAPPCSSSPGF